MAVVQRIETRKLSAIPVVIALLAAAAPPSLSTYIGKYPFDRVRGVTFLQHPLVLGAVRSALLGSIVRPIVLDPDSTSGPIARQGDFIVSWACEPHNCGDHQWSVVLPGSGRKAAVCYYNYDLSEGARWFVEGRIVLVEPNQTCQFDRVPAKIALSLVQ